MKIILLLATLILVSCNKDTLKEVNPLDPILTDLNATLDVGDAREEYLQLVNEYRQTLNLNPLIYSDELEALSQAHAQEMSSGALPLGHDGFSTRCLEAKVSFPSGNLCGEIVSSGPSSAQAVFNTWMSSSAHKAKIENARYTHTGLGLKKNASGKYYWSELFLEVR